MTDEERQLLMGVKAQLDFFIKSDRYLFQKDAQMLDGRNIQLATGTGTKIGLSASEKLGLWGVTPVVQVQPTGASGYAAIGGTNVDSDDTWTGGVGSQIYSVGDIVRALKLVGVILS